MVSNSNAFAVDKKAENKKTENKQEEELSLDDSSKESAPAEEAGVSVGQLQKDLEKNEKSLEITKQKKKEVKGEAFLPDLYFVLSDLYNEKARLQYLMTRAKSPKTPVNELDFSDSIQSKKMSLESLQTFIDNFPKNPDLDKAYFNMAQTYRELGLDEDMVKTQMKIISDFPHIFIQT
jgi:tetratricopeptide (TPR) repeat protein